MFPESSLPVPIHLGPLTKCKSTRWKWQRLPLAFTLKHFAATAGRAKGVGSAEGGRAAVSATASPTCNIYGIGCRCRCCCLTAWRALGVQRFDQEPGDKPGALWLSSGLFSAAAFSFFFFFGLLPTATPHISALRSRPHLPASQPMWQWGWGAAALAPIQCNTMSRATIDLHLRKSRTL